MNARLSPALALLSVLGGFGCSFTRAKAAARSLLPGRTETPTAKTLSFQASHELHQEDASADVRRADKIHQANDYNRRQMLPVKPGQATALCRGKREYFSSVSWSYSFLKLCHQFCCQQSCRARSKGKWEKCSLSFWPGLKMYFQACSKRNSASLQLTVELNDRRIGKLSGQRGAVNSCAAWAIRPCSLWS